MAWNSFKIIFGGSFDPIHNAHLEIAHAAITQTPFSEVWFLPSGKHRFKSPTIVLDFEHRFELVSLAIKDEPRFHCYDFDKEGLGDGTTYDLMKRLYMKFPKFMFSFLIGSDNLIQLPSWYHFEWLVEKVGFIIVERPDYPIDQDILKLLSSHIILKTTPNHISSSEIRKRIKTGDSIVGLVPEAIIGKIMEYYRKDN